MSERQLSIVLINSDVLIIDPNQSRDYIYFYCFESSFFFLIFVGCSYVFFSNLDEDVEKIDSNY